MITKWAIVSVVVTCSATAVVGQDSRRLPFPDGTYVTRPELCRMTGEQISNRFTTDADIVVRHIEGRKLRGGYEMNCEVRSVALQGNAVRFRAMCEQEGEANAVNGSWVRIDDRSFRIGNRTYTSCGRLIR